MQIAQIKDFPQYYITDDGQVIRNGKILKPVLNAYGYYKVTLSKNGKPYEKRINRLVAEAFIPNPNNLPCVNHKDENKLNNNVSNLEWCTYLYNNTYGTRIKRQTEKQLNRKDCSKAVVQFTLDGQYINTYPSTKEAWRQTGVSRSHISDCCNHYRNVYQTQGYRWAWKTNVLNNDGTYNIQSLFREINHG